MYNIHFSALPRHRGVATAIWPILNGDETAGVTFHEIESGIDTGNILAQRNFPIPSHYSARDLYFRFMDEGLKLVLEQVKKIIESFPEKLKGEPQNEEHASYHSRKDIDFNYIEKFLEYSAEGVSRYLRAFSFFEYQLPCIGGLRVSNFEVTQVNSMREPGNLIKIDCLEGVLATKDFDVKLFFDPHVALFAWAKGDEDLPDGFLFSKVEQIDRLNIYGWSALMVAAYACNIEAVKILVTNGADINLTNKRGTSVLMYARSGALETADSSVFEYLVRVGADPDVKDVWGKSIHWYLENDGQHKLLKLIN